MIRRIGQVSLLLTIGGLLLLFLFRVHPPSRSFVWDCLFDTGHILIFGVLAVVGLLCVRLIGPQISVRRAYATGIAASLLIGLGVEIWQRFTPDRTFELVDLFSDLVGALGFPLLYAAYEQISCGVTRADSVSDVSVSAPTASDQISGDETVSDELALFDPTNAAAEQSQLNVEIPSATNTSSYDDNGPRRRKHRALLYAGTGVVILLLGFVPLGRLTFAYLGRNAAFPVLLDFTHRWYVPFTAIRHCALTKVSPPNGWTEAPRFALVGQFDGREDGNYPGLMLYETVTDWSGYQQLAVDVYWFGDQSQTLIVRVHDYAYTDEFDDRFNREFELKAGWNYLRIPVVDIQYGPVARQLDVSQIHAIGVFIDKPGVPVRWAVGRIELLDPVTAP